MSEKGVHAHEVLCRSFSNVPAYEALSERSRGLLDQVGESFAKLEVLDAQFKQAEAQLDTEATAVEASLKEELGELVSRPRDNSFGGMQVMTMDQLAQMLGGGAGPLPVLDAEFDDDNDDPTYH